MNIKIMLIGIGILLTTTAWADVTRTIGDLLNQCRAVEGWSEFATRGNTSDTTDEQLDGMFCLGYIRGLTDEHGLTVLVDDQRRKLAAKAWGEVLGAPGASGEALESFGLKQIGKVLRYCTPDDTKLIQLAETFIAWADRNPHRWRDDMTVGVFTALAEAYPCTKTDNTSP